MAKKLFLWLHRWLGLIAGTIVLISSLTGCIYVFSDELKEIVYKDRLFINAPEAEVLPLSVLKNSAQQALGPSYKITRGEISPERGRSWIFRAYAVNPKGIGYWNYYKYYYRVYINPHNGEIIHIENSRSEFFQLVLSLHRNLLLGDWIGNPVVGCAVIAFVLILISGLVLWWPKEWRRKKLKKNFLVKWEASRKRLTYDLHKVLGFYILAPMLITALTGLVFCFEWADNSVQFLFNGGAPSVKHVIPQSPPPSSYSAEERALDKAVYTVLQRHPDADLLSIRFRPKKTAPIDIQTRLLKSRTHIFVWYYFDRQKGDLLMHYSNKDVRGGEKVRTMNYDLHTGSIGGIGTKLLAFVSAMACASLPITGFYVWYNKRRKKKLRRL